MVEFKIGDKVRLKGDVGYGRISWINGPKEACTIEYILGVEWTGLIDKIEPHKPDHILAGGIQIVKVEKLGPDIFSHIGPQVCFAHWKDWVKFAKAILKYENSY